MPHNKGEKLDFLSKFDSLNPQWLLCRVCLRYHRWGGLPSQQVATWSHHCQAITEIPVDKALSFPQAYWRLVKRAKYYDDPEYGLPIDALNITSWSQDWTSITDATWSTDKSLVIRITSMIRLWHVVSRLHFDPRSCGILGGMALCYCQNHHTQQKFLQYLNAALNECRRCPNPDLQLERWWRSSMLSKQNDILCMSCGMVFKIGMHFFHTPRVIPYLKIVRYVDRGPAHRFNGIPYCYLHDIEELYQKEEEGNLYDLNIEERHLLHARKRLPPLLLPYKHNNTLARMFDRWFLAHIALMAFVRDPLKRHDREALLDKAREVVWIDAKRRFFTGNYAKN